MEEQPESHRSQDSLSNQNLTDSDLQQQTNRQMVRWTDSQADPDTQMQTDRMRRIIFSEKRNDGKRVMNRCLFLPLGG